MTDKSSKIQTALLPSYETAVFVDQRTQTRESYVNWVWPALNGWNSVAVIGWDPTPCSKSTQLGSLYKEPVWRCPHKKTRVEASSDHSCFNMHHSQCLPLWLYNQTPPIPSPKLPKNYLSLQFCLPHTQDHTIHSIMFWLLTRGMMQRFARTGVYLQLLPYCWIFFNAISPIDHILLLPFIWWPFWWFLF